MEVYVHTPITILKTDDGDIPYSKSIQRTAGRL